MKTQAKGIRIQAKTAKCKNGENLKFMADSGSMQQFSKIATGRSCRRYYKSVRTEEFCAKILDAAPVSLAFRSNHVRLRNLSAAAIIIAESLAVEAIPKKLAAKPRAHPDSFPSSNPFA
jgi:hypothetical protein